ncbi:MAG: glutathione S-transferase [Hyphomicrobiales bacterium]
MKLHHATASPFVRTVMVSAHELGVADQIDLIDPGVVLPVERHEGVSSDNPLGRIPTLITDDGDAMYDSRVICEYLNDIAKGSLFPVDHKERFRALTLLALSQGVCDTAVSLRYETFLRPQEKQWDIWIERQNHRITDALNALEQNWLHDLKSLNVGTIGIAAMLGYLDFRFDDMGWRTGRPGLKEFYETFAARPSMKATEIPPV